MAFLNLGNIKSGAMFLLPLVIGGILGEMITQRFPIEQYVQRIPGLKEAPAIVQRAAPAVAVGIITVVVFSTKDITSAKWTIPALISSALLGVTVNLATKAVQSSAGGTI